MSPSRNFYDQGDRNPRHNLPGRPVNDPLLALLFSVGLLTALWHLRSARSRLLLIWFGVMLLPTLLSDLAPHTLRGAGALPALALLCALGGGTLLAWISGSARVRSAGAVLLLVAVLLVSGGLTARDYFLRYPGLRALDGAFDVQLQRAAQAAVTMLPGSSPSQPLLITSDLFTTPQMGFALGMPQQAQLPPGAGTGAPDGRAS